MCICSYFFLCTQYKNYSDAVFHTSPNKQTSHTKLYQIFSLALNPFALGETVRVWIIPTREREQRMLEAVCDTPELITPHFIHKVRWINPEQAEGGNKRVDKNEWFGIEEVSPLGNQVFFLSQNSERIKWRKIF